MSNSSQKVWLVITSNNNSRFPNPLLPRFRIGEIEIERDIEIDR